MSVLYSNVLQGQIRPLKWNITTNKCRNITSFTYSIVKP